QEKFVAPNPVSLAQAHFTKEAWYRAIYADETPVGFMMLYDNPAKPEYFLWRLMVDARYQGNGFAWRAVQQLVDYVRSRPGAKELLVSHGQGEGSPAPFYARLGFTYTGEEDDGELIMRLPLDPAAEIPPPSHPKPLTHVVLFKLKDRSPEAVVKTAEVLRSLDGKIAVLQGIEVGINVVPSTRAYDIALITRFASLADMELYQVHPIHQGVLAHMREVMDGAVAVDFDSDE
ncbi:MAG TPA: GNAT family N-acetyltransferase, partial [Anaerolineae bacterium]|nr:GNAT family N-acetyltransferase [Anaerolineae bacterium]